MEDTLSNNDTENKIKLTRKDDIGNEDTCDGDNEPPGREIEEDYQRGDTGATDGKENKSYPVILEAKPQHPGPALVDTKDGKENGLPQNHHASTNSSDNDGQIPENEGMPSQDPTESDRIVQYAVAPKIEGEELQVI